MSWLRSAPESEDKLLYLTTPDGVERTVHSMGEIPSATRAIGAAPQLSAGVWTNDDGDRRWADPTPAELETDIDHFHAPRQGLANLPSWAEWHYFNVLSADHRQWTFISYILAGQVPDGRWGAQLLVTTHEATTPDQPARERRFVATFEPRNVSFSTTSPDLRLGTSSVTVRPNGRYAITGHAREVGGTAALDLDLLLTPAPRAYFPGGSIETGDFTSGYVVPALVANVTGSICVDRRCDRYDLAQGYHDHNWGVWRGVTWEWGAARLVASGCSTAEWSHRFSLGGTTPLFVYLVDSIGFRAVFRPQRIEYDDRRDSGRPLRWCRRERAWWMCAVPTHCVSSSRSRTPWRPTPAASSSSGAPPMRPAISRVPISCR